MLDPVVGGRDDQSASARASCARRFRSPSITRNTSRSSRTAAASRRRARSRPAFSAIATARTASTRWSTTGTGRRPQRKPIEAAKQAARRGRLSERPRRQDRRAAGALFRHHRARRRGQVHARLAAASSSRRSTSSCEVRPTDYNRFQDKIRKGNAQIYDWGWNADYPDPENFLFLLHGAAEQGEDPGRERVELRQPGVRPPVRADEEHAELARAPGDHRPHGRDPAPGRARGCGAFIPRTTRCTTPGIGNLKPNKIANNTLKYQRIDTALREQKRARVEPAGAVADRCWRRGPDRVRAAGGVRAGAGASAGRRSR